MNKVTDPCATVGCDRRSETKSGHCSKHYKRFKRRGTTHDITHEERFFSRVRQLDDCWVWTGSRIEAGYGKLNIDGRSVMAHRWSYEFLRAEIPAGLDLDHLCVNPPCVNPWHLEPVTDRVNVVERGTGPTALNARKTRCIRSHEFTVNNTYLTPKDGRRQCRICMRIRGRK